MKVKIKSFNGELPSCFSEGVEYVLNSTVIGDDGGWVIGDDGGWVIGDDGEDHYILINGCSYLNGGSWEIVK